MKKGMKEHTSIIADNSQLQTHLSPKVCEKCPNQINKRTTPKNTIQSKSFAAPLQKMYHYSLAHRSKIWIKTSMDLQNQDSFPLDTIKYLTFVFLVNETLINEF